MADQAALLVRAATLCADVPPKLRSRAVELAANVLWMERKLADSRDSIADAPLAVDYDNGGGQTGVRKNPEVDAYNTLMSTYTRALKQLCEMLGAQESEDGDDDLDAILASTATTRQTRAG